MLTIAAVYVKSIINSHKLSHHYSQSKSARSIVDTAVAHLSPHLGEYSYLQDDVIEVDHQSLGV